MKYIKKIVVIFAMIIIFCTSVVEAKYIESKIIKYNSQISQMVIEVESDDCIKIEDIDFEKEYKYKFKLKNYNENMVSNVNTRVKLIIKNIVDGMEYELLDCKQNQIINFVDNQSDWIIFKKDKVERELCLKVKFNDTNFNKNTKVEMGIIYEQSKN